MTSQIDQASDLCWLSLELPLHFVHFITTLTIAFFIASAAPPPYLSEVKGFFGASSVFEPCAQRVAMRDQLPPDRMRTRSAVRWGRLILKPGRHPDRAIRTSRPTQKHQRP